VAGWTRIVVRHRRLILVFWVAVFLAGGFASTELSPLLSNTFNVPGTDSERVRAALEDHFGDRPDGSFTAVFELRRAADPGELARLQRVVDRAARVVPSGKPTKLNVAGPKVVFGDVVSTLGVAQAKKHASHAGTLGSHSATRSPSPIPSCARPRATRRLSLSSSE